MMFKSFNEVSPTARTKVWNNGFSDYLVPINMTEVQLDNRLSSLSISEELSKVFFIDNQPAGIYLHAEGTFSDQKIAWLGGMAVDSAFRNQQVSVKMLREFERVAVERGTSILYLEAIDGNERAISIYKKFGFAPVKKVLFLESSTNFTSETDYQLKKVVSLKSIGVNQSSDILWQNKAIHGYDSIGIYDQTKLIGYTIVSLQGNQLVIHQLELDSPKLQIKAALASLQKLYTPTKWIGSNLVADSPITKLLVQNGFSEKLSQHQYSKQL
ncbi:GNAT family N-acetyltransferase [Carnobacterium maltaromaticum]|uniref:GNAT family N-acetyltransferase n=1 Tax=Carnobacterium maltaromaticum TaxID=2751 RepID=UPI0039AF680D